MGESLQLYNWPIGDDRGYLKIVKPEDFYNPPPYNLYTFRDENKGSLDFIKEQANSRLTDLKPPTYHHDFSNSIIGRAAIQSAVISGLFYNTSMHIINRPIIDPTVANVLGLAASALIWIPFGLKIKNEIKHDREKKIEVNKMVEELYRTPSDLLFNVKKSEPLLQVAKSIEEVKNTGKMPRIEYRGDDFYSAAKEIMENAGDALTPAARSVYGQIIAVRKGYLTKPPAQSV
jgi:hypothetical protein